ncbi:MAG: transposase [Nitrososphaerales archaeon]
MALFLFYHTYHLHLHNFQAYSPDARWGFSRSKGWVFGYKLHIACSTGSLIVLLSADFSTANVSDNTMYESVTTSLPEGVRYAVADEGYDDHALYEFSKNMNLELVCPITRYEHTDGERLELLHFYDSELGQCVYAWRSKSVEPLI